MSYNDYIKAMNLAKECEDYCHGDGVTVETLKKAEKLTGIQFSNQLKEYLIEYGYLEFFGVEFFGIIKEDFSCQIYEGCIIEWTLNERQKNKLNNNWLPIRSEDDGYMAFLDFSTINKEGEPCVILAVNKGSGYEGVEVIADDLGNYILQLVDYQLENQ